MTLADVVASFERYKLLANKIVLNPVASWEAPDENTFVLHLKEPTASLLESMSSFNSLLVVMPADTAKEPNDQNFKPVGTGPFKLAEWVPDSHVKAAPPIIRPTTRFEGTDGLAGRKQACVDTVTLRIVTEPAARIAGLETGEFDIVDDVPFGAADALRGLSEVKLASLKHWWNHHVQTNLQEAPTDKLDFRQAVQILLDMDAIMEIATDGAYDTHPGWLFPGQKFYTDVGAELYNQKDLERAKALLANAGYNGEKVVIATNSTYDTMYKAALVMSEQMRGWHQCRVVSNRLGDPAEAPQGAGLQLLDRRLAAARQRSSAGHEYLRQRPQLQQFARCRRAARDRLAGPQPRRHRRQDPQRRRTHAAPGL